MNQFNILKSQGFSSYAKYVEAKTKEKEECLSKREYYKLKKKEKEELSKLPFPMTCEVIYAYDPNDVPDEVKNLIAYARELGALVKVKDAGIIDEKEFTNIKKRIQKSHKILSDMTVN